MEFHFSSSCFAAWNASACCLCCCHFSPCERCASHHSFLDCSDCVEPFVTFPSKRAAREADASSTLITRWGATICVRGLCPLLSGARALSVESRMWQCRSQGLSDIVRHLFFLASAAKWALGRSWMWPLLGCWQPQSVLAQPAPRFAIV